MSYRTLMSCLTAVAAAACIAGCTSTPSTRSGMASAARSAQDEVNGATVAVNRMKAEPKMAALLKSAHGVLIVPDYGKGAYIVGAHGGRGVLLLRRGSRWTDPAFYTLGGASIGLQAGGEAGPIAMVLMTRKAVDEFRNHTGSWRFGAGTGLTVVNFSGRQTVLSSHPRADIVMWSGVKGLYGGLYGAVSYLRPDSGLDDAYYHTLATNRQILSGRVHNPRAGRLREALASASTPANYR